MAWKQLRNSHENKISGRLQIQKHVNQNFNIVSTNKSNSPIQNAADSTMNAFDCQLKSNSNKISRTIYFNHLWGKLLYQIYVIQDYADVFAYILHVINLRGKCIDEESTLVVQSCKTKEERRRYQEND